MKTIWNCKLCHGEGQVFHEGPKAKTGAWEVFREIDIQHRLVNKNCPGNRRTIRAKLVRVCDEGGNND